MKITDFGYVIKNNVLAFQKGPLSQWWGAYKGQESPFQESGWQIYNCCEQYMMSKKAWLFKDYETLLKMEKEKKPAVQKELGRQVKNFNSKAWDEAKFNIVVKGNELKFSQNPELKEFLLSTYPYILVEAAPWDKVWGCGTGPEDERTFDVNRWQGQNLLGSALMKVRASFL
jgi:ribA/ribD-fused uncharacterized protein